MPITEHRITYIAFQECEIRGDWEDKIDDLFTYGMNPDEINNVELEKDNSEWYNANNDNCELWIVRPDGLRKGMVFKKGSRIVIRANMVKYYPASVTDELSVDEEKQKGN